jgi:hypothetical protein
MSQKVIRRVFWPLFVGLVVSLIATKTAYPSLQTSLRDGLVSAAYVLAVMYAVSEHNTGARLLRACVLTIAVIYLVYFESGLAWSLIPWGAALFVIACVVFLRKTAPPGTPQPPTSPSSP